MAFYVHRTLKPSFCVQDVVRGNWVPETRTCAQFLLNLGNAFEIHGLRPVEKKMQRINRQPFLSKVYSVCKGPEIDGFDSFYALRDHDAILFAYCEREELFVAKDRVTIPGLAVSSSFCWYDSGLLTVSAAHGGACVINTRDANRVIYLGKPSNCVMTAFPVRDGEVGRLENGPTISIYRTDTFEVVFQKTWDALVSHAFMLNSDTLVACLKGRVIFCSRSTGSERAVALPNGASDAVVAHATLGDRVVLLGTTGVLWILQDDMQIGFLDQSPKSVYKIFPLDSDLLYIALVGGDILVENVRMRAMVQKTAMSVMGVRHLYLGSAAPGLAPHGLSYVGDALVTTREGATVITNAQKDLAEPICGLYPFSLAERKYVIVSHQSSSKLLEVIDRDNIREVMDPPFALKDTVQTVFVAVLKGLTEQWLVQVCSDSLLLFHKARNPIKESALQGVGFCASNSRQFVMSTQNRTVWVLEPDKVLEQFHLDVNFQITALTLSTPDPKTGKSEFIGYGASENQAQQFVHQVRIQTLARDQASRVFVLSQKMPAKVSSLKFLDETRICVGLENGGVIIGRIDRIQLSQAMQSMQAAREQQLEDIMCYHYGTGPCSMFHIHQGTAPTVLNLNSRPSMVTLSSNQELVKFRPLAMNSVYCAAPVNMNQILAGCGRTLSLLTIIDNNCDVSFHKQQVRGPIVALRVIEKTAFVIIATDHSIVVYDEIKGTMQTAEIYDNETITTIDVNTVSSSSSPVCLGVATRLPDGDSILRLYTLNFTQTTVQALSPVMARVAWPISAIRVAAVSDCGNIVAGAQDTLMYFKQVSGTLQLVTQMSGVGVNIRHMVYTAAYFQSNNPHGILYIGDSVRSVKLLRYSDDSKQFQLFCEEGSCRSITALAPYGDSAVCGGDSLGNIFVFEYASILLTTNADLDPTLFKAKRRLTVKMNFHVGDIVTGVQFTSDIFQCMWYITIGGGFGGLILSTSSGQDDWGADYNRHLKLLRAVEMEVSNVFFHLTRCDHIAYRNKLYPASNVIDFDMVELYGRLSRERRDKIAERLRTVLQSVPAMKVYAALTPAAIDFEINRFSSYFLDWQRKQK